MLRELKLPAGRDGGYTIHRLRNSFKTVCINGLIPRPIVDAWQDHAADRAVSNVYYKSRDEEHQKFMRIAPFGNEA